ncbi:MAG: hypothetical protein WAN60_11835 [Candidatus Sulfotelmatobacter sp.]
MDDAKAKAGLKIVAYAVVAGFLYGLAVRFGSRVFPRNAAFQVMSLGFMVFLPIAIGFVTVFLIERKQPQSFSTWLLLPWVSVVIGEAATAAAFWEGLICIVMFTPIAMVASSVGGVAGGVIARRVKSRRTNNASLVCAMFLPLLMSGVEQRFLQQRDLRNVENVLDIQAEPAVVWKNIERVRRIDPAELQPSWSHAIGFPNPVEATLSQEGIGGVRHASFEGGVWFIETVDAWEPERQLGFSIRAQTEQIPPTTFDEHVTVGGKFFDVLHGEYTLESLPGGGTRLHLVSRHRVSTDFNWYAHLWTDAVMSDLQQRILRVVKNRAEAVARIGLR